MAERMGFLYVASGPLVRSSYKASQTPSRCIESALIVFLSRQESSSSIMFFGVKAFKNEEDNWSHPLKDCSPTWLLPSHS